MPDPWPTFQTLGSNQIRNRRLNPAWLRTWHGGMGCMEGELTGNKTRFLGELNITRLDMPLTEAIAELSKRK